MIITDGKLEKQYSMPPIAIKTDEDELMRMEAKWRSIHTRSGLLDRVRQSEVSLADAQQQVQ